MRTEATSGGGAGSAAVETCGAGLGAAVSDQPLRQRLVVWDSGWWSETAATAALAAPHAGAAGAAGAAVVNVHVNLRHMHMLRHVLGWAGGVC